VRRGRIAAIFGWVNRVLISARAARMRVAYDLVKHGQDEWDATNTVNGIWRGPTTSNPAASLE